MKNAAVTIAIALLGAMPQAWAQDATESVRPVSTWTVHSPNVLIENRKVYVLGAFTPPGPIAVRRVEALSNSGPVKARLANGELIPCPVQYLIELSNGLTKVQVPISNTFLTKDSTQTYTDSGPLTVVFDGQNRITVSLLPPLKQSFPPVNCSVLGLNITIQYGVAEAAAATPEGTSDNP